MAENLKELIRAKGRTQDWVRNKLNEYGIKRNKSHFNEWCNDRHAPKDEYILAVIGDILQVDKNKVMNCFTKYRENG